MWKVRTADDHIHKVLRSRYSTEGHSRYSTLKHFLVPTNTMRKVSDQRRRLWNRSNLRCLLFDDQTRPVRTHSMMTVRPVEGAKQLKFWRPRITHIVYRLCTKEGRSSAELGTNQKTKSIFCCSCRLARGTEASANHDRQVRARVNLLHRNTEL